MPTIEEEGEPDETWLAQYLDLLDATPNEEAEHAQQVWSSIAIYSPDLEPTVHVEQYAHYSYAGITKAKVEQEYATAPYIDDNGNLGLTMGVDPTVAKVFVGATFATEAIGADLIYHLNPMESQPMSKF